MSWNQHGLQSDFHDTQAYIMKPCLQTPRKKIKEKKKNWEREISSLTEWPNLCWDCFMRAIGHRILKKKMMMASREVPLHIKNEISHWLKDFKQIGDLSSIPRTLVNVEWGTDSWELLTLHMYAWQPKYNHTQYKSNNKLKD